MDEFNLALSAIRKKLVGKRLTYKEIYAVMDEISNNRLGDVLTTYFAASGYAAGFSKEELYSLTRAMVATGEKLHFKGIVADKHSIGGLPGTRTSLIIVPIVASAGFTIPKSSSRAITTSSGTADDMEVLAPVVLSEKEIYRVVAKTNGCIVWGGSYNLAPADDIIIKVEEPLRFESYDKILVSIMAKKIAFGSTHVVIDLPYGNTLKVQHLTDAEILKEKFEYLAKRFGIKIKVLIHRTDHPAARGIGPVLEVREALKVLEQSPDRSLQLEERSLNLAGALLELCLLESPKDVRDEVIKNFKDTRRWAAELLGGKFALAKMRDIIKEQGGNPNVKSSDLVPGEFVFEEKAHKTLKIESVNNKNLTIIAKILGSPDQKKSGIYLNKTEGETAEKGDIIFSLYSETKYNLKEAKDSLKNIPIFSYS